MTIDSLADWIAPLLAQREHEPKSGRGRGRGPVVIVPPPRLAYRMASPPASLSFPSGGMYSSGPPTSYAHRAQIHSPQSQPAVTHRPLQHHVVSSMPPLPHSLELHEIPGVKWIHSVGKARRMYVSAGVSTFAEVMRPWVEKHYSRVFTSFSEVVACALPFWDTLSRIEREAWQERAVCEGKQDHCIYMRSPNWEQQTSIGKHRRHNDTECGNEEDDSDPDELPGPLVEDGQNSTSINNHNSLKITQDEKLEGYSNDVRQSQIQMPSSLVMAPATNSRHLVPSNSTTVKTGDSSAVKTSKPTTVPLMWERGHSHVHRHPMNFHRGTGSYIPNWNTEKRKTQPFEGRTWTIGRYTAPTRAS